MSITQLPSVPTRLIIAALFPTTTPQTLFAYWTQPALLQQWWPQQARRGEIHRTPYPFPNRFALGNGVH